MSEPVECCSVACSLSGWEQREAWIRHKARSLSLPSCLPNQAEVGILGHHLVGC